MKIAGVSVNKNNPPSKENLIKLALNTVGYYQLPKDKAIKLIQKEIKDSGLYKTRTKRVQKSNEDVKGFGRLSNARKTSVDKRKDS